MIEDESCWLIEIGSVSGTSDSFDKLLDGCVSIAVNDAVNIISKQLFEVIVDGALGEIWFSTPILSTLLALKNRIDLTGGR